MGRRILLTGATGFVGRHVHRTLVERGHAIRIIARAGSEARRPADADVVLVDDVFAQDRAWWTRCCDGIDTIVHAAWHVTPPHYLSSRDNIACLQGSLALAEGAKDAGVAHLIGLGTCFEYAFGPDPLRPDTRLYPTSLYAASKAALYVMLTALFAGSATTFTWARLFYLYGEGEAAGRLVPYLRERLSQGQPAELSAGTQVRDFLDVAVAAGMIADLVDSGQGGPVNICSGVPITIRQLVERIADEYGRRDLLTFGTAPLRPTDPPCVVGICNLGSPETVEA